MRYILEIVYRVDGPSGDDELHHRYRLINALDEADAYDQLHDFAARRSTVSYSHGLLVPAHAVINDLSQGVLKELYRQLRQNALMVADEKVISGYYLRRARSKARDDGQPEGRPEGQPDEPLTPLSEAVLKAAENSPAAKVIREIEARKARKAKTKSRPKAKSKAKPRARPKPRPRPKRKR